MLRSLSLTLGVLLGFSSVAAAVEIHGGYLESRTCDVYTGPCFANAEVGLTGRQAILAWNVDEGSYHGIDLSGLKVVLVVNASDTLALGGGMVVHPDPIKSVVLVDDQADEEQREALIRFARERADRVVGEIVRVESVPIEMSLDHIDMVGRLKAGAEVEMLTRKLNHGDCICTNETVFYPPLADVDNSEPAFTIAGKFEGRGLGTRWSIPGTRSAFLATFAY